MTERKATPEQWSDIERFARDCGYDSCLLELRSRVEALEAAAKPAKSNYPKFLDSSLVDLVTATIDNGTACDRESARIARDAILEVAAWLRQRDARVRASVEIASDLEQEVKR